MEGVTNEKDQELIAFITSRTESYRKTNSKV